MYFSDRFWERHFFSIEKKHQIKEHISLFINEFFFFLIEEDVATELTHVNFQ